MLSCIHKTRYKKTEINTLSTKTFIISGYQKYFYRILSFTIKKLFSFKVLKLNFTIF